jgi:energy-coupling factor transport system ATP-binding protein
MEDMARFADEILVMDKAGVFCRDSTPEVFKRADELRGMGLAVPQITRVFNRLKQAGVDVRTDVYTVEFAVKTIKELLAKGANPC